MQRSLRQYDPPQRSVTAANTPSSRPGFTLIELMVVIIVIAILAAMMLPAINSVRSRALDAKVVTDIKNIEAAIAAFKAKYGVEPPSSFRLHEDGVWSMSDNLDKNSVAIMRQLWPTFPLRSSGSSMVVVDPMGSPSPIGDFNGNGSATDVFTLNGAECLIFFLGGPGLLNISGGSSIPVPQSVTANGFSANPSNPFAGGGSRVGPFLELDASRLSDVNGNGAYELLDPYLNQTRPYQYLSSYNGRAYQPFGYDGNPGTADDEVIVLNGVPTMFSIYLKTDTATASAIPQGSAWNTKTFQLISPGRDAEYGVGGLFTVPGTNTNGDGIGVRASDTYRNSAKRQFEIDNITNFSRGPLQKTFTPAGW